MSLFMDETQIAAEKLKELNLREQKIKEKEQASMLRIQKAKLKLIGKQSSAAMREFNDSDSSNTHVVKEASSAQFQTCNAFESKSGVDAEMNEGSQPVQRNPALEASPQMSLKSQPQWELKTSTAILQSVQQRKANKQLASMASCGTTKAEVAGNFSKGE